jgi:hypothetical protein
MKLFKSLAVAAIVGLLAFDALTATQDINGVKVQDTAQVQGTTLTLNGAGTRYKFMFKVYVASLYLGKKANSPDEVLSQVGPKRLSVTMVRDIDADELGKLLTRGIQDNIGKTEMSKLVTGLARLGQIFADQKKMLAGDNFLIDWVPGLGTVITVKGKVQGEPFKEPEFFKALMSIWLGPVPADAQLKEGLLGASK